MGWLRHLTRPAIAINSVFSNTILVPLLLDFYLIHLGIVGLEPHYSLISVSSWLSRIESLLLLMQFIEHFFLCRITLIVSIISM